jgi:subtilase family serine protease
MKKNSLRLLAVSFCALLVSTLATAASAQDFVYRKKPLFVKVPQAAAVPAALPFCGTLSNNVPLICYSPGFLQKAYNFPSNLDGSGQTIVIVDAFGSPTIKQDWQFSTRYSDSRRRRPFKSYVPRAARRSTRMTRITM